MNFKDIIDAYLKTQEFTFKNGKLYNGKGDIILDNTTKKRDYSVGTKTSIRISQ